MKKALTKTRYGIPAALLILLFAVGTAVAAVTVATFNPSTKTTEPIAVNQDDGFDIAHPGESDTITYSIANASNDVKYGVVVDIEDSNQIKSVSYEGGSHIKVVNQGWSYSGDAYDAKINVGTDADGTGADDDLTITVKTKAGVEPGKIKLTVNFIRYGEAF